MKNTTGQKIKSLRQKLGVNQAHVAQKLNLSVPAYSKIETGLTDINLTRLMEISAIFNVPPASLLPDSPPEEQLSIQLADQQALNVGLRQQIILLQKKLITAYETE